MDGLVPGRWTCSTCQRIELLRWTQRAYGAQLTFANHAHDLDTARIIAADQKALNPSIGRTSRFKGVPGEPICGLYSDQSYPSRRVNSAIMIHVALGIF
jgi:hypothetical protein